MGDHEAMLSTREVADRLQISRKQVMSLIRRGELPAAKFNARVFRVAESDLRSFIEQRRTRRS